jgi:hypothetical protein
MDRRHDSAVSAGQIGVDPNLASARDHVPEAGPRGAGDRRMRHAAFVLTLLAAAAPAAAETPPGVKSESGATALAVGITAASVAATYLGAAQDLPPLAWAGLGVLVIAPSAGHIYAGEHHHAAALTLVRSGGLVLLGLGVHERYATESTSGACPGPCPKSTAGEPLMALGIGTIAIATLYDLYDAHRAAHRANLEARTWTVAPAALGVGGRTPGLALAGAF